MKTLQEVLRSVCDDFESGRFFSFGNSVLNPQVQHDSPLETELERVMCKYICPEAKMLRQFQIPTYRGTFRLDLAVMTDVGTFGFECDGRQYHDWTRDIFRDAVILNESMVRQIFRIEGPDVFYRLETALFVIGNIQKGIFSNRGMENLWTLSECRDDVEIGQNPEGIYAHYQIIDDDGDSHERPLQIRALSKAHKNFQFMVNIARKYRSFKTDDLWSIAMKELGK